MVQETLSTLIQVLASLVKNKITEDVRKVELFSIIADGTTDKLEKGNPRSCLSLFIFRKESAAALS